ncbi:RidA family protein [Microvirga sp. M2]|uniref:RidA family protein n=1 Tax=Microvirga sp. M2 TaxID=3073270 RepID=UPI0039C0FD93
MIDRLQVNARMSQIVTFPLSGTMVMLAGQVATTREADTEVQTREVLDKIDSLLSEAGATKEQVVSAWIWLKDIADFEIMNSVWDQWVVPGHAPARACVEARLAHPDLKVEIQVFAVKA